MLVVLAALGGGAYVAYVNYQDAGGATRFRYVKVLRGSLTSVVSPSGTLDAINMIQVGSQISGQIRQLYADYNSRVQKDQVIAQIASEVFEAKVDKARADLSAAHATVRMHQAQIERAGADRDNAMADLADAKAQLAKSQVAMLDASRTFKRKKELYQQGLIPRSEMDSAQATYDSAVAQTESFAARERAKSSALLSSRAQLKVNKAQLQDAAARVKQSEASLRQADEDLKRTIIRSPVGGVVVSRNVDVGQTVAASLQAPTLFTIAEDLKRMQVNANVDEADIGRIRLGQRTTFTVDAFPGQSFSGKVIQIRRAPQVIQNVVTYNVVISVSNDDLRLFPGMTANVSIVVEQREDVLKVPNGALRFTPSGVSAAPPSRNGASAAQAQRGETPNPAGRRRRARENRQRLIRDLGLTDEQQSIFDQIFQENRQKFFQIRGENLSDTAQRTRTSRLRQESRAKIRAILTAEQKVRYDKMTGGPPEKRRGTPGRVWVKGEDGRSLPVSVRMGMSDGTHTEVLSGDLREGQAVIVGIVRPSRNGTRSRGLRFRF